MAVELLPSKDLEPALNDKVSDPSLMDKSGSYMRDTEWLASGLTGV